MAQLRIEPEGIEREVSEGTPLVRALWQAGIAVETPCGGFGLCGKCKVQFVAGAVPPPGMEEERHLQGEELEHGWRLACRHLLHEGATLVVPEGSRPAIAQVLTEAVERSVPLQSAVQRLTVQVPPPSVADERSEVTRLLEALRLQHGVDLPSSAIPLPVLRTLPTTLRQSHFTITVILHSSPRILSVEPSLLPASPTPLLGIAFDIGTTTLVGYLLDLETGQELALAARLNPQVQYGDDVVSRLNFAIHERGGLRTLQHAVVRGLNEIIAECCQVAGVEPSYIYEAVAVGNTAMMHLLLGVDPEPIAFAPYVAALSDGVVVEARQLGLRLNPNALLVTLPCLTGYLGADTVAMVLTHLWEPEGETAIALDIGTNGEVVLRHQGCYWCASAAAGPAFEGGRIYQGMRAETGAIAQVTLEQGSDGKWLQIRTIGGGLPTGICGSGLIDAVAALLQVGAVQEGGRLEGAALPPEWERRLVRFNGQKAFTLVHPEVAGNAESILLTQHDVRELQLAKGSIRAVTEVLLLTAGIKWDTVSRLYIAGAFGMYVNHDSARRIGLLPPVPSDRLYSVGNAAGAGAKLALRSLVERHRAQTLAGLMRHVPMTGNLHYQNALLEFVSFPNA